jgi:hypothetical protein
LSEQLRDRLSLKIAKREYLRKLRGRRVGTYLLCIWLAAGTAGCSFSEWYVDTYNKVTDTQAPPATPEQIADMYTAEREAAQAIVSKSSRLGKCVIPTNMKPTIAVVSYDIEGQINFTSEEYGSGKVGSGEEYFELTQNAAGEVGDSASSHGTKDSRWNKYWGNETKRFVVVLVKDRKELLAYSEVTEIEA